MKPNQNRHPVGTGLAFLANMAQNGWLDFMQQRLQRSLQQQDKFSHRERETDTQRRKSNDATKEMMHLHPSALKKEGNEKK
jgi:hypothetical protein